RSLNRQVILEAKIIEVELNDEFRAGINWARIMDRLRMAQVGGGSAVSGRSGTAASVFNPHTAVVPNGEPTEPNWSGSSAFGGIFSMALTTPHFSTFV